MCVYIYIYMYVCMCVYIYIYIYVTLVLDKWRSMWWIVVLLDTPNHTSHDRGRVRQVALDKEFRPRDGAFLRRGAPGGSSAVHRSCRDLRPCTFGQLFVPTPLLKLNKRFAVEQLKATESQSTVPYPFLGIYRPTWGLKPSLQVVPGRSIIIVIVCVIIVD